MRENGDCTKRNEERVETGLSPLSPGNIHPSISAFVIPQSALVIPQSAFVLAAAALRPSALKKLRWRILNSLFNVKNDPRCGQRNARFET